MMKGKAIARSELTDTDASLDIKLNTVESRDG